MWGIHVCLVFWHFYIIIYQIGYSGTFRKSQFPSCNYELEVDGNAIYKLETRNYSNSNMNTALSGNYFIQSRTVKHTTHLNNPHGRQLLIFILFISHINCSPSTQTSRLHLESAWESSGCYVAYYGIMNSKGLTPHGEITKYLICFW